MELISLIVLGFLGIVGAASSRLLADEFKAWSPWLVDWLIRRAVRKLEPSLQDRLHEEWHSHAQDIPGDVGKLLMALSLQYASAKISNSVPYFERICAGITLTLLLPLMLFIAAACWSPRGGPILYRRKTGEYLGGGKYVQITTFQTSNRIGPYLIKLGYDKLPILLDVARGTARMRINGPMFRENSIIDRIVTFFRRR